MADRDFTAFTGFLSPRTPSSSAGLRHCTARRRSRPFWKRFYEQKEAPFRWEPAEVEVLDAGTLALSSVPVFDPAGKQIATFTSIWRQEAPGVWRIVFDKGNAACDCARP